ncbi:hypothetical protein GCM10009548_04560 [Streptomyces malaysiensis subsp. malaysiensis]
MTAELQRAPVSLPSVTTTLAEMGLDWLGYLPIPVPHAHRRALRRFRWPDLIPAAAN